MTPPLPRPLRRTPPKPGENGRNGAGNGRDGGPATKPASAKEQAVEGVAGAVGWLDERTGASPFLRGFL